MPKTRKKGPSPRVKEPPKDYTVAKRVGLGIFLAVGTVIIAAAAILLLNITGSANVKTAELSDDLDSFLNIYNEYNSLRDLPGDIVVTKANFINYGDKYTIEVEFMNSGKTSSIAELQLFYTEDFIEFKPMNNPFVRYTEDDEYIIYSGETKSISVTGALSADTDEEELKEAAQYIYVEMIVNEEAGRIMLPLSYISSTSENTDS